MQLGETVSSTVAYLPWLGACQTQAEGFLLRCVAQVAADAMARTAKPPAQPAGMEMDFWIFSLNHYMSRLIQKLFYPGCKETCNVEGKEAEDT